MVDDIKKEPQEELKCEFCDEVFEALDKLQVHKDHAHYRDTYKPTDRERRLWAKHCLSTTREVRKGKKELQSLITEEDEYQVQDPDYQEE